MPTPPTLSFTIPSIHDDLPIECRIFHPACLNPTTISQITGWRKRAAVIAHPYATLGGSYDDPVVGVLTETILKEGFIVGTFNFRGAEGSKGSTSWLSKGEQGDYISLIAFLIYYVHHLSPAIPKQDFESKLRDLSPVPSQIIPPPHLREISAGTSGIDSCTIERLILGGFSYGALITTFLPASISSAISAFESPSPESPHASIRLRATKLACEQTTIITSQIKSLLEASQQQARGRRLNNSSNSGDYDLPLSNRKIRQSSGVRVGGEEDLRRASHDSYRPRNSFNLADAPEKVRKSIERVRSLARDHRTHPTSPTSPTESPSKQYSKGSVSSFRGIKRTDSTPSSSRESLGIEIGKDINTAKVDKQKGMTRIPNLFSTLQVAYILISPPVNAWSGLASLWSMRHQDEETASKLSSNPTLALFGNDDGFIGVKKFRAWAEKLENLSAGKIGFRYTEVQGAGHFWRTRESILILKGETKDFLRGL